MARIFCKECEDGHHGACNGEAYLEVGGEIVEVECWCAGAQHLPSPDFPDAADVPIETDPWSGLHLYGCAVCRTPTESEPCAEHQPNAAAAAVGEQYLEPALSPRRASDVPLWDEQQNRSDP